VADVRRVGEASETGWQAGPRSPSAFPISRARGSLSQRTRRPPDTPSSLARAESKRDRLFQDVFSSGRCCCCCCCCCGGGGGGAHARARSLRVRESAVPRVASAVGPDIGYRPANRGCLIHQPVVRDGFAGHPRLEGGWFSPYIVVVFVVRRSSQWLSNYGCRLGRRRRTRALSLVSPARRNVPGRLMLVAAGKCLVAPTPSPSLDAVSEARGGLLLPHRAPRRILLLLSSPRQPLFLDFPLSPGQPNDKGQKGKRREPAAVPRPCLLDGIKWLRANWPATRPSGAVGSRKKSIVRLDGVAVVVMGSYRPVRPDEKSRGRERGERANIEDGEADARSSGQTGRERAMRARVACFLHR
jgi:hypothetical protein